jgi:hypothetical protein
MAAAIALGLELPEKLLVMSQGADAFENPGPAAARSDAEPRGESIESADSAGARSDAEPRGEALELLTRAPTDTIEPRVPGLPSVLTEPVRVSSPQTRIMIAGAVAALLAIIALIGITVRAPHTRPAGQEAVAALAVPVDPPRPLAIVEVPVAPVIMPAQAPVQTPTRRVPPRTAKPRPTLPAIPVNPPTTSTPPAPPEPTARSVAEHYASVGRALKRLDTARGQDATLDLWPRYRLIRINAAIASRDSRDATTKALVQLAAEIDARAR